VLAKFVTLMSVICSCKIFCVDGRFRSNLFWAPREPILGTENVADFLTKPIAQAVLDHLRPRLHLEDSHEIGSLCATRQAKGIRSSRVRAILACSLFWAQASRAGALTDSSTTNTEMPSADDGGQALLIMCLLFSFGLWLVLWLVQVAFGRVRRRLL